MIWKIANNNDTASIKLRNLLILDSTILDNIQLETQEQTNKFKEMFTAYFNEYEIGGETPEQFKQYIQDVFNEYKDYYQEYINIYSDKINYLDGYISKYSEDKNDENTVYDLPNKQVSDINGYRSGVQKISSNVSYTKTGGINVVDQKFNYLNKLKNVYLDFVKKFLPCFLLVY